MNELLAAVINGAIPSVLTAAAIWMLLRVVPRSALNAATRYIIWWIALAITVALPLLFVRLEGRDPSAPNLAAAPARFDVSSSVPASPIRAMSPGLPLVTQPELTRRNFPAPARSLRLPAFPIELSDAHWTPYLFLGWLILSLTLLTRLAINFVLLNRLRLRSVDLPGKLAEHVQQWIARSGKSRRTARLLASRDIAIPVAAGPWRPSILIPAGLLADLKADELDRIGLHEAAHLARRDDYALLMQRIVEALFALHPVVRWIARRIDLEREIACDDLVVAALGNPISYATCLVRLLELSRGIRPSLTAVSAADNSSHLACRVDVLLDNNRHTGTFLLKARLAAILAVMAIVALAAGRISSVVVFAQTFAPTRHFQHGRNAKVTILPLQAAAGQPDQTQDLAGQVLEDSSGNPLPSAELRFQKAGMREFAADLETDRQGRFHASGLPPGEYTVDASKPNYVGTTFKLHIPSGNTVIRLVRYGVIDGQASDAQGRPLPGRVLDHGRTTGSTRITVLMKAPGTDVLQTFRESIVDDAGHYRIYDLPPGEYILGIWYYGQSDGSGMQLYPDNSHPRSFTVLGGEEYSNINFVVLPRPAWQVSGKLALPPGVKGQFQLALGLPDQPTLPVSQTLTDTDGTFRFDKVPAGTYDLFAAGPTSGYTAHESILRDGEPLFGRTRIQVAGQNMEGLSIPVTAGQQIKVLLRAAGSDHVPEGCPQSAALTLTSLEPWGILFMSKAQAAFAKEQTVSGLAPGRFRIDANELGGGCFQVKRPEVNLSANPSEPVVVEIASAGSIQGTVRGGGVFAVVLLDAGATDGAQAHLAFPEPDGSFSFEALRPGRYRLSAQTSAQNSTRASAEGARARWVSGRGGVEVEVAGGAPTRVQLAAPVPDGGKQ